MKNKEVCVHIDNPDTCPECISVKEATGYDPKQLQDGWEVLGRLHREPIRAACQAMNEERGTVPVGEEILVVAPAVVDKNSTIYSIPVPQCDLCGFTPAAMYIEEDIPDPMNVTEAPSITRYCLACYDGRKRCLDLINKIFRHELPFSQDVMVEIEKVVGEIVSMSRRVFLSYEDK